MFTAAEIPSYRCVAVSIGDTTSYYRRYAAQTWVRAHHDGDVWYETPVPAKMPETVCGYYSHRTLPLSEYPV